VVLVCKAADEIIVVFLILREKESGLLVTSNKLTNNFAGLITEGLESDVALRLPGGSR
jgi:hypothetical protein